MNEVGNEKSPHVQDALIEAMARSCAERGYPETSVEVVAASANCSEDEFFRYFATKEECVLAAVEAILADGMSAISDAYSPDTSEWESALAALRALLELFASRPAYTKLAFIDSRQTMPSSALQRYESGFAILTAMLDRLREEGNRAAEPPVNAARAAIGGGEALVRRELMTGGAAQLPKILPALVYAATLPFLGQEEALRISRQAGELLEPDAGPDLLIEE